jgi:hypothetical protein
MKDIVWKKIGSLPVKQQWNYTTFLFGDFYRLSSNSDNDRFVLGFFNFPQKDSLINPRTIKIFDKAIVNLIPLTPYSQICIGIRYELNIDNLIINIEVGSNPNEEAKKSKKTSPRGAGIITNATLANQLPYGLDDPIG